MWGSISDGLLSTPCHFISRQMVESQAYQFMSQSKPCEWVLLTTNHWLYHFIISWKQRNLCCYEVKSKHWLSPGIEPRAPALSYTVCECYWLLQLRCRVQARNPVGRSTISTLELSSMLKFFFLPFTGRMILYLGGMQGVTSSPWVLRLCRSKVQTIQVQITMW